MLTLYGATILVSAFLLFQIQPVIAKTILPWFGGTSAVWSVCMLFFQVVLLLGYVYAHHLHRRFRLRTQILVHSTLLAISLLVLPVIPGSSWKIQATGNPSLRILLMLAVSVGLPYFLLSTTSPLVQTWYARTHRGGLPYRLYALSNLASLAALLSYPFAVEPYLTVRHQALAWSWGYAAFTALCGATAWLGTRSSAPGSLNQAPVAAPPPPTMSLKLLWLVLAACPSILLLSVTEFLTQDVAAIPFLWILPLGLYLLSFILCFESGRYYRRRLFFQLALVALAATSYLLTKDLSMPNVLYTVAFLSISLFIWCMACHGELARLKPHPAHLTAFYVMVSAGGALGGLFVALIAPAVFGGYYEFPAGLALFAFLLALVLWREGKLAAPRSVAAAGILLAALLVLLGAGIHRSIAGCRVVARNFYGQLRVRDIDEPPAPAMRKIFHGVIDHGQQLLHEPGRPQPTAYYCPGTGGALALQAPQPSANRRIGLVGLGCGTLVSYGRPGDLFRLYEINPLVLDLARSQFTFLSSTPARTEAALGDARRVLEDEEPQSFDALIIDAFSGDSVPVHLLTREAFAAYFRHLKPDGILAVHITNRYLNLAPVVAGSAAALGKSALLFEFSAPRDTTVCFSATWMLVMDPARLAAAGSYFSAGRRPPPQPRFRTWTDDYSSLFSVLR